MDISDRNRFVTGSKDGHVTIWTDAKPVSKRVFDNATIVKYINNKIYAIGRRHAKLTVLNMNLETTEFFDYQSAGSIMVLVATDKYVAVGDSFGYVNVFDNDGSMVLVSCVRSP